jgi:hypothetical protein
VEALVAAGKVKEAGTALVDFDHRYGALLPEELFALAAKINPAYVGSAKPPSR